MTKLSATQDEILHAAAHSDDGTMQASPETRLSAAGLIKRGLLISLPQAEGPSRLLITAEGRAAIAPGGGESPPTDAATVEAPPSASPPSDQAPAPKPRRLVGPLVAISRRSRAPTAPVEPTAPTEKTAAEAPEPSAAGPKGKVGALLALLRQPGGTSVEAMMVATGWQAHSVRGAMSGAIKKGLGVEIVSEKTETGRVYRVPAAARA